MLISSNFSAKLIIKSDFIKRKLWPANFFDRNDAYWPINNQRKSPRALGLHKLIFVLLYLTIIILLMTKSGVTTESGGRQNMFPSETRPYIDETVSYEGYPQNAEKVNGRWAMVGFVALLGSYITTGQIIPGVF